MPFKEWCDIVAGNDKDRQREKRHSGDSPEGRRRVARTILRSTRTDAAGQYTLIAMAANSLEVADEGFLVE